MGDAAFTDESEKSKRRWRGLSSLVGLMTVAALLFELTHQPAIGTAVLCSKFGWSDFRTAWWLWRVDPWKLRGRTCFYVFIAWGICKITIFSFLTAVIALVGMELLVSLGWAKRQFGGGLNDAISGASVTCLVGDMIFILLTAISSHIAKQGGFKLWIHPSISVARCYKIWPPSDITPTGRNRLGFLIGAASFVPFFMFTGVVVSALDLQQIWPLMYPASLMLAWGWGSLHWSAKANAPTDCWPLEELEEAPNDPVQ